ncbi:hypothetical protein ABH931_004297 [Streptacidiphilus sp. MAP12-33]|uniref:hypothetical protein n=1 Tax=Streptacidiphilus sp. MAP12-33 TaxID=3156266 RepID=UPI003511D4A2
MCIRIRVADPESHAVVWDPLEVCVLAPLTAGAWPGGAVEIARILDEVAAILADVGARRTWSGFRCFCGEPILLPPRLARLAQLECRR